MLPLLAGAARGLLASGARSAVGQTAKSGVKNALVGKVKDKVKEKSTKISKEKLLSTNNSEDGGKGGALVKTQAPTLSKVFSSPESAKQTQDVKEEGGKSDLLSELIIIKTTLIKIQDLISSSSKLDSDEYNQRKKDLENLKRKQTEQKLEQKKSTEEKDSKLPESPKLGLFDRIKRFLLMTFLGALSNWAFTNLPKIISTIEGIAKGVDNLWEVLKFAIISITTNFPRQIRFLAKLTTKLFAGPAKFIGKIIFKAGKTAFNLLVRAGTALLNFVRKPVTAIAQKILGFATKQTGSAIVKYTGKEAAKTAAKETGKQTAKKAVKSVATNAGKLASRLKAFSKVFKRVPIVGALIGIGIDLALGEPLDRAVVGAIGSTIGAAIGGAIGTGVIPIPVVGTAVGGFVGGAIGDWLAKKLYGDLTGRVSAAEKEAQKSESVQLKSDGGLTRTTVGSLGEGLTRETGVQKRTFEQKQKHEPILRPKSIDIDPAAISASERFFGLQNTKYLKEIGNLFGKFDFIGNIMRMTISMIMGGDISKSLTDTAADSMSESLYREILNEKIEIPGVDKENLLIFTNRYNDWVKTKLYNEFSEGYDRISQYSGAKPKRQSQRSQASNTPSTSGPSRGEPSPTGPSSILVPEGGLTGLTDTDWKELAYIVSGEAGPGDDRFGVAAAVLNRVANPAWPNSIKAVGSQPGQFEAVYKGKARYDQKLADDLKKNQGKVASALQRLNGRDSFKGQSQLSNKGSGDIMFDPKGNFYHYTSQVRKSDPAPTNPNTNWKKWISTGGMGGDGNRGKSNVPYNLVQSKLGADQSNWDIFRNTIASIESGGRYNIAGGSGGHYDGRYQLGAAAKTDGSRNAGVKDPGHSASARSKFRSDPSLQELLFAGYTIANHNYLMRNKKYAGKTVQQKLQILGYAHNQGMGGAERWLNTGVVGADGFGTKGTKYTDALAKAFKSGKAVDLPGSSIAQTQGNQPGAPGTPAASVEPIDLSKAIMIKGDPRASNSVSSISSKPSYDSSQPKVAFIPTKPQQASPATGGSGNRSVPMLNSNVNVNSSNNMMKQIYSASLY